MLMSTNVGSGVYKLGHLLNPPSGTTGHTLMRVRDDPPNSACMAIKYSFGTGTNHPLNITEQQVYPQLTLRALRSVSSLLALLPRS